MTSLIGYLLLDNSADPLRIPAPDTRIVHDLHEALSRLQETAFEAVACRAPSEKILDLAHRIRETSPGTPLVFLFDRNQAPLVAKCLQSGFETCLCTEGLSPVALGDAFRHAVSRRLEHTERLKAGTALSEARLEVESHRKAYRRISDDLRSASRAFASMEEINRLFSHATDEMEAIRNFCRVLVKGHGYRMAWSACPRETPEGLDLVPLTHAGEERGFLSKPLEGGPAFRAILKGHPWAIQDIGRTGEDSRWAVEALERGYRSMAVLPFTGMDGSGKVLCVFADSAEAFSADRLALLAGLAGMLSRGLASLGEKRRRQESLAAMELMDRALRASVGGFVIMGLERGILYANEGAVKLAGYSSGEEVTGLPYWNFVQVNEKTPEVLRAVLEGGHWTGEFDLLRKDGTTRGMFGTLSPVPEMAGEKMALLVSFIDLAEMGRAERELDEARALHESIINDQADMILRFLPESLEITYANIPYARYYRTTPGKVIGQSFRCRYTPEQETRVREHLALLTPENPVRRIEEKVLLPSGEIRWQHWVDRGIFGPGGRLVEVQGVGRDITDLKEAQEALLLEKSRLETLFQNSPDGIVYCSSKGRVESVNPAFCSLFGYEAAETAGRGIDELVAAPGGKNDLWAVVNGEFPSTEGTFTGKNGARAFVSFSAVSRNNPGGSEAGIYLVFRDLAERLQKEEVLKISHAIIEGSPAVVFRWRAEKGWPVEYVSENISQFGYSAEELTRPGFLYSSLIHPDDLQNVEAEAALLEAGKSGTFSHQYRLLLRNGDFRWVVERNRAERDPGGRLLHHFGVILDDTERRKAEIEARKNHEALQESLRQLEKSFGKTIEVLSSTTEARDPYTAGHQRKVATLSAAIARRMGLPEKECEGIYLAAMVHDIGKISIPAELLSKPSRLNPLEMALIRTHPDSACEILAKVESPWRLAEVVRQHHERMDGSGYPRGLRGEEILLEARIIAVADVLEAVASDRPYRPARGLGAAMTALEEGRGTLYDAGVVETCRVLFEEGFSFEEAGDEEGAPWQTRE